MSVNLSLKEEELLFYLKETFPSQGAINGSSTSGQFWFSLKPLTKILQVYNSWGPKTQDYQGPFQLCFKPGHSMETSYLLMTSDRARRIDSNSSWWLWILDFSDIGDVPSLILKGIAVALSINAYFIWQSSKPHSSCSKSRWQLWFWRILHRFIRCLSCSLFWIGSPFWQSLMQHGLLQCYT